MRPRIIILAFLLSVPTGALADSLDGDWCNPVDGKLTIDGSQITTPAGNRVTGNYGRHRFEYTAPAGGWNGGKSIVIQQFNEQLMELSVERAAGRQWRPCQIVS